MSEEDAKSRGVGALDPQPHHPYGTFQGVPDHSQPVIGFPQPSPPPGASSYPAAASYHVPPYYSHGYQAVPVYAAVAEGRPLRMRRHLCCGLGIGWFLFIIGFFLAAVPWYVGAFILLCVRVDYREKPGFVACTIAAVVAAIAIILGVTKGVDAW